MHHIETYHSHVRSTYCKVHFFRSGRICRDNLKIIWVVSGSKVVTVSRQAIKELSCVFLCLLGFLEEKRAIIGRFNINSTYNRTLFYFQFRIQGCLINYEMVSCTKNCFRQFSCQFLAFTHGDDQC